ncbi:putative HTH-type transcriptional regulator YjiR [Roseovarius albus]|uniref:Putative HTH-type transcriptional regulator YjiR n=1 Tax=Roseovarius albus TaxID=1247867 RepID=A0A1X6ZUL0_9RHOB|nr:PLP-dependent aminotransferase family protein [Roseovarius albus]SLN61834.1 putative HTH-type transcriptional regulator YjiR [Roseovarius albus]
MTNWRPSRDSLLSPLHVSLAASIANAIEDGRLPPGEQLPTHRKLADDLGLSVNTVSKAYDVLRRQNLIDGQIGRGSYVIDAASSDDQPFKLESEPDNQFDMSISRPLFNRQHVDAMHAALKDMQSNLNPALYLSTRPNLGHETHRKTGVKWLSHCGLQAKPNSIIMTNGVTHGMSAALSAIMRPGDVIMSDMITHHLMASSAVYFGYRHFGLETDEYGICPDALERACIEKSPKALYMLPSLANPNVHMMPEFRRRQIAEVARKHGLYIIENDAFGPVAADRQLPISSLIPDLSIYLTTFTKCTVSGLRVGYAVVPDHLMPAMTARLIVFGWMATPIMCELATRWVEDGTALALAEWQRREIAKRHEIATQELAGLNWTGHPASLHLWLKLSGDWDSNSFVAHARELNVVVAPESPFLSPKAIPQNAVRVSVGSIREKERFRQGLKLLVGLLGRPREPMPQVSF